MFAQLDEYGENPIEDLADHGRLVNRLIGNSVLVRDDLTTPPWSLSVVQHPLPAAYAVRIGGDNRVVLFEGMLELLMSIALGRVLLHAKVSDDDAPIRKLALHAILPVPATIEDVVDYSAIRRRIHSDVLAHLDQATFQNPSTSLRGEYIRLFDAMLHFVVFHEIGHIALGHLNGDDQIAVVPDQTLSGIETWNPQKREELEADRYSIDVLKPEHRVRGFEWALTLFLSFGLVPGENPDSDTHPRYYSRAVSLRSAIWGEEAGKKHHSPAAEYWMNFTALAFQMYFEDSDRRDERVSPRIQQSEEEFQTVSRQLDLFATQRKSWLSYSYEADSWRTLPYHPDPLVDANLRWIAWRAQPQLATRDAFNDLLRLQHFWVRQFARISKLGWFG